ncbi:MAG: AAA family ATPase [Bacilli bacterium]
MVEYLKISNLALLKEAQLEFSGGFTVVTGETGAGKSVLLGALSMLAGNRCGREIVGKASDTCKVEAVLHFKDPSKINAYLEGNGIPACEEGVLVIARTVSREKSGRAFVNGALVPLSTLSNLGAYWIDFHGRSPRNFSLCATSFRCWIHLGIYKICRMHI